VTSVIKYREKKMKQITIGLLLVLLLLGGCGGRDAAPQEAGAHVPAADEPAAETAAEAGDTAPQSSRGSGMGMGNGGGMMGGRMDPDMRARHQAPIPADYAGLTSPIAADAESLARGEEVYSLFCVACHGESGMGDGPTAAALNPAPPSLAMTSRMMGDDYLYWRISEGGAFPPFNSAMPAWKASVNEEDRWHLVNYMRTLGGDMQMGPGMSGGMEQAMRAEMLAAGEEQGILTEDESKLEHGYRAARQ
jgi:mono/diheme cytochrome c family protein